jgi:DNA-binding response OmpR family regulator
MKIAILEDQPDILELLTTGLELAGHHAYPYRTGTSLVDTLLTPQSMHAPLPYDLLIIDLYLPGTPSGMEVINAIHQHIPPGTLPIILTSATSQSELSDLQAHLPTVTVLRQPFHLKDLLALIERRALSPTPRSV